MLSRHAIEVGLDPGPNLIAPGLFGLRDQVLRNAAMRQHELRPAIGRRCQRDRGHREDAFGESAGAPRLNDSLRPDEIDAYSADTISARWGRTANLPPECRLSARDRRVPSGG